MTRLLPPGWTVRPLNSGGAVGTVFGKYGSTHNSTSQAPLMTPMVGSKGGAIRSATAWLTVLPQKSVWGTGSSGRSKRQAQYRVTGAPGVFVIACIDCTALPTGETIAAGQDQRGSVV